MEITCYRRGGVHNMQLGYALCHHSISWKCKPRSPKSTLRSWKFVLNPLQRPEHMSIWILGKSNGFKQAVVVLAMQIYYVLINRLQNPAWYLYGLKSSLLSSVPIGRYISPGRLSSNPAHWQKQRSGPKGSIHSCQNAMS